MLDKYLINNYDKIKETAYNIANENDYEDLLHFVIEELYKCNKDKINDIIINKDMRWYIIRIMVNQYHSKTSRYYKKYKKYYDYQVCIINDSITNSVPDNIKDKEIIEDRLNWIEKKLKNLHWFDAEIFKLYYSNSHSLNSLSKATKINRNTIYHSVNKVKKYLKNEK